jgi:hypothetical protein
MPEQKYKRLTRECTPLQLKVAFSARYSLWLGDDHLLQVESAFYTESYKRFFFRDIQAITIRKTDARKIWNWILGAFLLVSALLILMLPHDADVAKIVLGCIVLTILGIPLLLNNLFGPTCACQIRTAVQTENLPSLRRVRQTRKVLDKVRPLIVSVQGEVTSDEVNTRMREMVLAAAAPATPATETPAYSGAFPPVIS